MCETFRQLRDWEAAMVARGLAKETRLQYRANVVRFLADTLMDPREMTRQDVERFLGGLSMQSGSRKRVLGALTSFFNYLEETGAIDRNPAVRIQIRSHRRLPKFVVEEDLRRVFDAAEGLPDGRRKRLALELAYLTGARVGSLVWLRPQDIDFRAPRIQFNVAKGDKPYSIRLNRRAQEVCRELLDMGPSPHGGAPYKGTLIGVSDRALARWCQEAGEAAGVPLHPHLLRHSFATHLRLKGVAIDAIQPLMNHSSIATTQIYTEVAQREQDSAVDLLDVSAL